MKNNNIDKDSIIRTLAVKLPDATLEDMFPGIPATAVRNVLQGKSTVAGQPARQQNLFTDAAADSGLSCKLFTDGASRGNPGEAGAGIVLLDNNNREIAARSLYLGQCTNNVAEYEALLLGLETAGQMGCNELTIFMDSQLIVRQVMGQYKVKNIGLKPLFDKAKIQLEDFEKWSIEHVPREQNKRADELANRGIEEKTGR